MKRYPLFSALLLSLASAANADVGTDPFYLGTGAGAYLVNFNDTGSVVDVDASAPARRIYGGYVFSSFLSLEGGYNGLFEVDEVTDPLFDADVVMKGSSFDVFVRPTLPLGKRAELFGIVGYTWYDWDVSPGADLPAIDPVKGHDWQFGAGGGWRFNKRWSVRAEWTQVQQSDVEFNLFTASASYSFR